MVDAVTNIQQNKEAKLYDELTYYALWNTWCDHPAYSMLMCMVGHDGYDDSVGQDSRCGPWVESGPCRHGVSGDTVRD